MVSRSKGRVRPVLACLLIASTLAFAASPGSAVPSRPGTVFDDFDDGDTGDWIFFGGNAAGGGGGPADDRPKEGSHYLSTGWGGNGTNSGFYGGFFRNLDDAAQVSLPTEPWFNVWWLAQSDTTVDSYNVEITLREDLDGNGWTNGAEDSIGYDVAVGSAAFDDTWRLLSAPLSAFSNRGTGGNGVFDGDVDELVVVFGGVEGADGTVIEFDIDQIVFSSGGPVAADSVTFDDLEHGDPGANGWFSFGGAVGGGGIGPSDDVPPGGGAFSLESGWGSGGTPGFYGGFGRTNPTDISGAEYLNFWINPNAGQDYTLEINLQEDDNSDGAINQPDDDEFQFDCAVGPDGPCAIAGGGWQLISLPLADFYDDNGFLFGGNGILDPTPPGAGGNGELINVVVAVIGSGSDANFLLDELSFSILPAVAPAPSTTIDDFESGLPFGSTDDGELLGFYTFQGDGSVSIDTAMSPPAPAVPDAPADNDVLALTADVSSFSGYIHAFTNEPVDAWIPQDWSTSEGIAFWMHGTNSGTQLFIDILDNRNPDSLVDDAERFTVPFVDDFEGWQRLEFPFNTFVRKEIGNGAPNDGLGLFEMFGYALGTLGTGGERTFYFDDVELYGIATPPDLAVNLSRQNTFVDEGTVGQIGVKLNRPMRPDDPAEVSIDYATERSNATAGAEYTPASGTLTFINGGPTELFIPLETFDDTKFEGDEQVVVRLTNPVGMERGPLFQGSALIRESDPFDPDVLDDFEQGAFLWDAVGSVSIDAEATAAGDPDSRPGQDPVENVGAVSFDGPGTLVRDFPIGQDWTGTESVDFWYHGQGDGDEIIFTLKDNRAPDPGPDGWSMVWSDEFNEEAGTPPNPANWAYELGDTTPDGKNGWGNEELQYYTDDPANSATDGEGNLVITLTEADGSQECYYGPCEFESARLITQNKAEFAYGRIESRLKVPTGGDGLWPAFWSLGTDITYNPWPGAGEIDVMEYVSRIPNEIFGTIHGPGYNGGGSFSGIWDFGERVDQEFHTFTVEWEPELITWYVDDIMYHQARPSDVAPNPWVFEKPFFLLLNFAIGGNFGGAIDPDNTYPQEYLVDYVRVYQGPDTAEQWQTTFTDDVAGWQRVSIPVADLVRGSEQPIGAPDDGLGLTDVWGYSMTFLGAEAGDTAMIDLVERVPVPPPSELVVTNTDDAGEGSLREALALIGDEGTITFADDLGGETITLTSGQLVVDKAVWIDGPDDGGITVSGGDTSRVFQIEANATVTIDDIVVRDGVGAPQGGGILSYGRLTLERATITDNTQTAAGPPSFDLGGGGIYVGDGGELNLIDSTVSDNESTNQPGGGVYGFFNSRLNISGSTISGNVSGDVAGGLRTLGDLDMTNSTVSGNTSSAWHGGALFATDGVVDISFSTIVGNIAPDGTAGGLMIATFGAPVAATIADNVIADNGTYNCQLEGGDAAVLLSAGGNVLSDDSCAAGDGDQVVGAGGALVGELADNGGPTHTHALLDGSPAIDAALGECPATDQRGVERDGACDVGAFEVASVVAVCLGLPATITGSGLIIGTEGDDVIVGSNGADRIEGRGGNDVICGGGGDDTLVGGAGDDVLSGGDGADQIRGSLGVDTVTYEDAAAPVLVALNLMADDGVAGEGDRVDLSVENVIGSAFGDTLLGNDQPNHLDGGAGDDLIRGRAGDDSLVGGAGDDRLIGGVGSDELRGGADVDYCRGSAGPDQYFLCETILP